MSGLRKCGSQAAFPRDGQGSFVTQVSLPWLRFLVPFCDHQTSKITRNESQRS